MTSRQALQQLGFNLRGLAQLVDFAYFYTDDGTVSEKGEHNNQIQWLASCQQQLNSYLSEPYSATKCLE